MQSKLLADENVPWPLIRLLRSMGLDVMWIAETSYRGISDKEVVSLANRGRRVILTRDSDFLNPGLRGRVKHGMIYIGEPIRKDNLERLARNIVKALEVIREKPSLVIVTSYTLEVYPLTP